MSLGKWFEFGYLAAGCGGDGKKVYEDGDEGGIDAKELMQCFARADCDSRASSEAKRQHDGTRCFEANELYEGGDKEFSAALRRARRDDDDDDNCDHHRHDMKDVRVIRPRNTPCSSLSCSVLGTVPMLDQQLHSVTAPPAQTQHQQQSRPGNVTRAKPEQQQQQQQEEEATQLHYSERAGHCCASFAEQGAAVIFGGIRNSTCGGATTTTTTSGSGYLELESGAEIIKQDTNNSGGKLLHRHIDEPPAPTAATDSSSAATWPSARWGATMVSPSPHQSQSNSSNTASEQHHLSSSVAIMIGGTTDCATYQPLVGTEHDQQQQQQQTPMFRTVLNEVWLLSLPFVTESSSPSSSSCVAVRWTRAALLDPFPATCFGQAVRIHARHRQEEQQEASSSSFFSTAITSSSCSVELLSFGGFLPSTTDGDGDGASSSRTTPSTTLQPRVGGDLRIMTVSILNGGGRLKQQDRQPTVHTRLLRGCFGTGPTPRGGHSMVAVNDDDDSGGAAATASILVFGGFGVSPDRIEGDDDDDDVKRMKQREQREQAAAAAAKLHNDPFAMLDFEGVDVTGGKQHQQQQHQKAAKTTTATDDDDALDYGDLLDDDADYDVTMFGDDDTEEDGNSKSDKQNQVSQQRHDHVDDDDGGANVVPYQEQSAPVMQHQQAQSNNSNNKLCRLSDCYILNLDSKVWRRVDMHCPPPLRAPRCFATIVRLADPRRFLVLGGEGAGGHAPVSSCLRIDVHGDPMAVSFAKQGILGLSTNCVSKRHGPMSSSVMFLGSQQQQQQQQFNTVLIGGVGWKNDAQQRLMSIMRRQQRDSHSLSDAHQLTCISSSASAAAVSVSHKSNKSNNKNNNNSIGVPEPPALFKSLAARWLCAAELSTE